MNILVVGSGAREHAIVRSLHESKTPCNLFCFATHNNPGIAVLATTIVGDISDSNAITEYAKQCSIEVVIIGPEAPLEARVADSLANANIFCFGPKQSLARIETSKSFTRELTKKYSINVSPKFRHFSDISGVGTMLDELGDHYVIKVDGLMGGKGVKVSGDHLSNRHEAFTWCRELLRMGHSFVIEEKLDGEEFSFISVSDGKHVAHTFPIQDHKRAYDGDTGPNTGGMGTYSGPHGTLPFLTVENIESAKHTNEQVLSALEQECGEPYVGVLYGGFMSTKNGTKLIEYNARFGDPEAMNIFSLLSSDAVQLMCALKEQRLTQKHLQFSSDASVCVYAVPDGYPDNPVRNRPFITSSDKHLYFGAAAKKGDAIIATGSRTVAAVGRGSTIALAKDAAYAKLGSVKGDLWHRADIGSEEIVQQRILHMNALTK